jgi:hypothetical protein
MRLAEAMGVSVRFEGQSIVPVSNVDAIAGGRKRFSDAAEALGLQPVLRGGEECPEQIA